MTRDTDQVTNEENQKQARNIIFSTLSDQALHVDRAVIENSKEMVEKPNKRCDS